MSDRWTVIFGCFVGLLVSCPSVYNTCFSLYLPEIAKEMGWDRAVLSLGFSIPSLVAGTLALPVGWLIDRFGARNVILAGTILFPVSLFCLAGTMPSLAMFLASVGLIGLALALVTSATYLTLPPQWHMSKLGLATACAALGLGVGALVMPIVTQHLIGGVGWREAMKTIALVVAVIGIGNCLLFVRDNPALDRRGTGAVAPLSGFTLAEAIRSPRFYLLSASFCLIIFVAAAYAVHIVAILGDRDLPPETAAIAMSVYGGASLLGRFVGGVMLDRTPYWMVGALFIGGQLLGGAFILGGADGWTPFIGVGLIGMALGAESDFMPVTLRHFFGLRAFGRIYGLAFMFFSLGGALGPLAMGLSFDRTGSYDTIMTAMLIADLLALVCFVTAVGVARAEGRVATPQPV